MRDQRARVQGGYDEMASVYADSSSDPSSAVKDLIRDLEAELDPGDRVLDAGCGDGTPIAAYFAGEYEVVGLDISREQLRRAQSVVPRARLLQGAMSTLGFQADAFEAVAAFYSIIHVPLEDHRTVFEEFARVMAPGGRLLFSSGAEAWSGRNPDWLDSGVEMVWSIPDAETTESLLTAAGFELIETAVITDPLAEEGTKQFFAARL